MRSMKDATGFTVRADSVSGRNAYSGMLEGTPYLARKLRFLCGCEQSKRPGQYVDAMKELECEIAAMPRDSNMWAPREEWTAKLLGAIDWDRKVQQYLLVTWYQEGCDPRANWRKSYAGSIFGGIALKLRIALTES